jgi:hypothetical protein
MDATSFEFSMQMPGDRRLLLAVRDLAAHAANYALLGQPAASNLADEVAAATEAAIASTHRADAPLALAFRRHATGFDVTLRCEAGDSLKTPPAPTAQGLSVSWVEEGGEHVCRISQRVTV